MKRQFFLTLVFAWALAMVFAWGIAIATAGQQAQQNTNAPAGNAANGRKNFVAFGCYQCHGYEAQGGAAGPRLAPRPIAYAQFMKYVRHPTNQMPPFTEKTVTDAELTDIYAFLRGQPAAPDVDKIPLLK